LLIYGGTAFSYANDPDFTGVSSSVEFWQKVIDAYYTKYKGVKQWHDELLNTVKRDKFITIPSGRSYEFKPTFRYGDWQWPLTTIKNYPVQGFGADLVMLARIEFYRRFKESQLEGKIIQTIHDSIVVDTPSKNCYTISMMLKESVELVPELCKRHFNYDFSLPLNVEIQTGVNKRDLKEYNLEEAK
jgi:DNA polymerase I-like protein with 3'-5' exonuclease and polymerase domains